MRIAIDYTPALRQGAGIGRYTRGLVTALAEIDRQNRYALFCRGESAGPGGFPANFSVRASRVPARWLTVAWHRLHLPIPAEAFVGACDLYHSPDFTLPPLRRARGIVTVHDLSFLRVPECADPGLRAFLEKAVPDAVSRAHRILADSEHTRRDLIELLAVPSAKISVVTPAVEAHFHRVSDAARLAEVRGKYRLPARFILGVGTLEPRKNFARLITAFGQFRRLTGQPHKLVIVGKPGWLYDAIYEQITREGLSAEVILPGFVADSDLPAMYSLADVLAFPSLYEGFGIPPLEAMACGTPVVTSDNSSLPEAAGDAARMVNAEDTEGLAEAITLLVEDAVERAALVARGYVQAARFTWRRSAEALVAAYQAAAA